MGFTIEEGQESYPLFSPASHCPLTVRTLETLGHNRDPRMAAARILEKYLPTGEWVWFVFVFFNFRIVYHFFRIFGRSAKYKSCFLRYYPGCVWLFCIILSHHLHCTFPSITKEITKTGDANLFDHLTGAHGDSADTVSVQLPWSQWIVQPSSGRFCPSKYNPKDNETLPRGHVQVISSLFCSGWTHVGGFWHSTQWFGSDSTRQQCWGTQHVQELPRCSERVGQRLQRWVLWRCELYTLKCGNCPHGRGWYHSPACLGSWH